MIFTCDRCGEILDAAPDGCRAPDCPRDGIEALLYPGVPDGMALWGSDLVTQAEYDLRARRHVASVWIEGQSK